MLMHIKREGLGHKGQDRLQGLPKGAQTSDGRGLTEVQESLHTMEGNYNVF